MSASLNIYAISNNDDFVVRGELVFFFVVNEKKKLSVVMNGTKIQILCYLRFTVSENKFLHDEKVILIASNKKIMLKVVE